jgi:hypothetical protein
LGNAWLDLSDRSKSWEEPLLVLLYSVFFDLYPYALLHPAPTPWSWATPEWSVSAFSSVPEVRSHT